MVSQTTKERNAALIQKARDIVADIYEQMQNARDGKPENFETEEAWAKHIKDYSGFLRSGAYDEDLAVQSAFIALGSRVSA